MGVPFLRFNYKQAARKSKAYGEIKSFLPYLTREERYKKYIQRYGVNSELSAKTPLMLLEIEQ